MIQQIVLLAPQSASFPQPLDMSASSVLIRETSSSTISREMDCENEMSTLTSSFPQASPMGEQLPLISPVPYSRCEVGFEGQNKLTGIGGDWAMDEEASIETIENFPSQQQTQGEGSCSSLYNFYFETISMDDCDDFSISTHGSEDFEDEDFCLERITEDPASFWEKGVTQSTQERTVSPAQISVGSDCESPTRMSAY
jgi:hypothetical protein